jgi:hypothetical protein
MPTGMGLNAKQATRRPDCVADWCSRVCVSPCTRRRPAGVDGCVSVSVSQLRFVHYLSVSGLTEIGAQCSNGRFFADHPHIGDRMNSSTTQSTMEITNPSRLAGCCTFENCRTRSVSTSSEYSPTLGSVTEEKTSTGRRGWDR